jgi:HEPN domain-containing protein
MKEKAELVRGWVRKGDGDRLALDVTLRAGALEAACFHAQQAVEKYLKAFLTHRGVPFPYSHNLAKLVELCAGVDSEFRSLLPTVEPPTPFAVRPRYDPSFSPSERIADESRSAALAASRTRRGGG